MTGYGKVVASSSGKTITIEIRSLNSRQLDINLRIPQLYKEKEFEIRSEISSILERGKIDFIIVPENNSDSAFSGINKPVAIRYHQEILALAEELKMPVGDNLITSLLKLPEVLVSAQENLTEEEWDMAKSAIKETLEQTDVFRREEGKLLETDIRSRIHAIMGLLESIAPFEAVRIINLRERFERNLTEFIGNRQGNEKFDENRFEQEIFWYLEKLDISEEKLRLAKHCQYFLDTMNSNESNGRKLAFISQEIGREINTLGSKASDAEIQKVVVQMKDELEKIKEQLNNIL
jgi:uncharacterized protein (TIGR00255 family)